MEHQDWTPVVIKGSASTSRAGAPVRYNEAAIKMAKLDAAEGPTSIRSKVLAVDSVKALQEYRRNNNLTQKQLDQQLSIPSGSINSIESRKAAPSSSQMQTLIRLTGTALKLECS
jgi:DNA-binding XRE family transcriptional regulator